MCSCIAMRSLIDVCWCAGCLERHDAHGGSTQQEWLLHCGQLLTSSEYSWTEEQSCWAVLWVCREIWTKINQAATLGMCNLWYARNAPRLQQDCFTINISYCNKCMSWAKTSPKQINLYNRDNSTAHIEVAMLILKPNAIRSMQQ